MLLCRRLGSEILEVSGCRVGADQPGHLYFIFNPTSIPSFAITYYYPTIFDSQTKIAQTNILIDITRVPSVIGFVFATIYTNQVSKRGREDHNISPRQLRHPPPKSPNQHDWSREAHSPRRFNSIRDDYCNHVPFTSPVKPVSPYWKPNSPCLVL